MLPVRGTFELVHPLQKSVKWRDSIEPQATASIHTVSLSEPLLLLINLDFCRSSEGVLVHRLVDEDRSLSETVFESFKGLLDDSQLHSSRNSIMLTDSVGQRLRLQIENKLGGGGNRRIVIYCPYWVVNTSQYSLRLREDGAKYLPAGTFFRHLNAYAVIDEYLFLFLRGHAWSNIQALLPREGKFLFSIVDVELCLVNANISIAPETAELQCPWQP